eukprot:TRINITY_DN6045_c0_g1_i3.p1 TRINITY_DN6045_c0_g1~~TRINITY_DN6045_c0_g1_i3.p1  ORF type:complete len:174 (+),score=27.61 TRINITY_DN6045_c0_g1_i3:485-1006(+)
MMQVVYRDKEILIFRDKYACSTHHLDAIPIEPIPDISSLRGEHLPLVRKLYGTGLKVLTDMHLPLFKGYNLKDYLISGFSLPVSVFHLHLHLVLPPLFTLHQFKFPRFHSYEKVESDLRDHGRVISHHELIERGEAAQAQQYGQHYHQTRVLDNHAWALQRLQTIAHEGLQAR